MRIAPSFKVEPEFHLKNKGAKLHVNARDRLPSDQDANLHLGRKVGVQNCISTTREDAAS